MFRRARFLFVGGTPRNATAFGVRRQAPTQSGRTRRFGSSTSCIFDGSEPRRNPSVPDTFGGVCKASSAAEQKRRWRPYGACRRTPKGKPLPRHSPVWRQRRSPRRGRWPKRLLHANREIGVPMIVMHSVGWQHGCQGRLFAAPCFRSRLRKHATGAAFLLRPLHLPESQFKNAVVVRGLYALLLHTGGQQHLRVIRVIPFR